VQHSVEGRADPAFAAVREVFEQSLASGGDLGAAVAVFVDGRPVVDLWGGVADSRTGRAWTRETPCATFSCTKAVTATAALMVLEERGRTPDEPATVWWPEFGVHGKQDTTLADMLAHSAGLPAFDRPVTVSESSDPAAMADLLASQRPVWEPGTKHGYHALTFGWLVGEFVRRHSGATVGEFVRRHVSDRLCIGAPVAQQPARVSSPAPEQRVWNSESEPIPAQTVAEMMRAFQDPDSLFVRSSANPVPSYKDPVVIGAGWPATGLITTARDLAAFYNTLIDGKLIAATLLREAVQERVRGRDNVLILESAFGLGYMLPSQNFVVPESASPSVFGHPGAGGSVGLGDLEHRVALAYIPNMRRDWLAGDRRAYNLIDAVYEAL
jgi:CubicO group peptidase (beta-lactamase class C family)